MKIKNCREYEIENYKCADCGSTKEPYIGHTYEFSDRDGNRGVWVRTFRCADCGFEYGKMLHY